MFKTLYIYIMYYAYRITRLGKYLSNNNVQTISIRFAVHWNTYNEIRASTSLMLKHECLIFKLLYSLWNSMSV